MKVDLSLPLKLFILDDLKAKELLCAPLTSNNAFSLHASEEDWFYLTRLMPSPRTDLDASGQSLALGHLIHISSAIINSLIVRSIGYIARFFLSVHPRQNIALREWRKEEQGRR
jgi:hypothetical protein